MAILREERIGNQRLLLGDCLQVMGALGRFDACLTDPPYGIGIADNPVRQKHARKDWDAAAVGLEHLQALRAITSEQIIWGGNYFILPPSREVLRQRLAGRAANPRLPLLWVLLPRTFQLVAKLTLPIEGVPKRVVTDARGRHGRGKRVRKFSHQRKGVAAATAAAGQQHHFG